jgi:methylglyoxal/glyoxal reductase
MPFFSLNKETSISSKKLKELRLESWIALEKLYADGKCKCIGVSNYMPKHLEEIIETKMSMPIIN